MRFGFWILFTMIGVSKQTLMVDKSQYDRDLQYYGGGGISDDIGDSRTDDSANSTPDYKTDDIANSTPDYKTDDTANSKPDYSSDDAIGHTPADKSNDYLLKTGKDIVKRAGKLIQKKSVKSVLNWPSPKSRSHKNPKPPTKTPTKSPTKLPTKTPTKSPTKRTPLLRRPKPPIHSVSDS